jgi:hypothetical protein
MGSGYILRPVTGTRRRAWRWPRFGRFSTEERPSAGELAKVWYASGADIYVEESDMSRFFEMLLSELKGAIAATDSHR